MNDPVGNKCTMLVSSFDGYSDLWKPYFALLFKAWPNRKIPVALITEELDAQIPDVKSLCLGKGHDWSSLLIEALNKIDTPYILFTLEDFFIREDVDEERVEDLISLVENDDLNMLRLTPRPGPDTKSKNRNYGWIADEAPYKVSTQIAIWKKDVLLDLLVPGESAWEFEHFGSERSRTLKGFAGTYDSVLPYGHHVIERGKWFPWDYSKFSKMGIGIEESCRPVMSKGETFAWALRKIRGQISSKLPRKFVETIKSYR